MKLVVIDHHQLEVDITKFKNIKIVTAFNLSEFFSIAREYIKQDYDLVISDEDPDGITSAIIYALYKNKKINFKGDRKGLKKEDIYRLKDQGIKNILTLDWFPFSRSDLKEFNEIIFISPRSSNLRNVNTSDIIYNALPETGRFGRDLSAIGTVCDYLVENSYQKMKSVVLEYSDLFPELVVLANEENLDRYNIYKIDEKYTKFFDLSLMFWAPFIIQGEQGNETLIKLITENRGFSLRDLFKGSANMAVMYLTAVYKDLIKIIEEEKKSFDENKKEIGSLIFYEVKANRPGFMSKFSSIICDNIAYGKVIAMKVRDTEKGVIRYSLRTKKSVYNLGRILTILDVGGGHEEAAGGTIPIDKEEWLDQELVKAISPLSLPQ